MSEDEELEQYRCVDGEPAYRVAIDSGVALPPLTLITCLVANGSLIINGPKPGPGEEYFFKGKFYTREEMLRLLRLIAFT